MPKKTKKNTFQRVFITGLFILIPIAATAFVMVLLFNMFDGWLAPAGGKILRGLGVNIPADLQRIPGFGIVATFLLIFFTGVFASNYLGRQILQFGDRLIKRLPIVNSIYSAMRQVVTSFSITGSNAFKTVVMFEYPRKGIWAIGFITSNSLSSVEQVTKKKMVNVFLPTTPNPTSGYLLMVPEKEIYPLPITPENGLKIIATVGLIQTESPINNPESGYKKNQIVRKVKKSVKKARSKIRS